MEAALCFKALSLLGLIPSLTSHLSGLILSESGLNRCLLSASFLTNLRDDVFCFSSSCAERPSLRKVTNNVVRPPRKRILLHCRPPYIFKKSPVVWVKLPSNEIIHANRTFRITRAQALRFKLDDSTAGLYQCSVQLAGITLSHASLVSVKG